MMADRFYRAVIVRAVALVSMAYAIGEYDLRARHGASPYSAGFLVFAGGAGGVVLVLARRVKRQKG